MCADQVPGRGDRIWISPAASKVARQLATVTDVVLGPEGRPLAIIAGLVRPAGDADTLVLTFERGGHG